MNFADMQSKLESRLKPSRYRHSVGVSETAVFLAERFGVDVEKARVAGLLHDCARQYKNDDLKEEDIDIQTRQKNFLKDLFRLHDHLFSQFLESFHMLCHQVSNH